MERNGEAWYVNPDDNIRYFLGRPYDAFNVMRSLGLGISNNDLNKIALNTNLVMFENFDWKYGKYKTFDRGYKKNNCTIIYKDNIIIQIPIADVDTFKVISLNFAKDKNNIYYKGKIVNDYMDSDSFDLVVYDTGSHYRMFYLKDKNFVYDLEENIINGADSQTIIPFGEYYPYAKDKNNVYYGNITIQSVDIETFQPLISENVYNDNDLAKDKNNVYYREKIIQGADPKTFTYLGGGVSKDKNNVYKRYEILDYISVKGFKFLEHHYSVNYESVFHYEELIENADPVTFEVLADGYAIDRQYVFYKKGIIKEADRDTFEVSNAQYWYARDKYFIYNRGKIADSYPTGVF